MQSDVIFRILLQTTDAYSTNSDGQAMIISTMTWLLPGLQPLEDNTQFHSCSTLAGKSMLESMKYSKYQLCCKACVRFLVVALTNCHKFSDLKQHKVIILQLLDQKCNDGLTGLKSNGQQAHSFL